MPKRYLWAVGESVDLVSPEKLIGDRYLCKAPRIFLDTKPGLAPNTVEDIPPSLLPYLRLNAYQLHVPQAYGWVSLDEKHSETPPILLLERAAIAVPVQSRVVSRPLSGRGGTRAAESVRPLPALIDQWATASAMRQLNWLWQIAKLWQPLATEQVATSLLNPDLLRVEDSLVRLLDLQADPPAAEDEVSLLVELGHLWLQWVPEAQPDIQSFLKALCQHLTAGNMKHPGQLVACLDRALNAAGQSQVWHIDIASQTDKGPNRPRNEDACYPAHPGTISLDSTQLPDSPKALIDASLMIVCDGIGGHLGGDVASRLAIDVICKHLYDLPLGRMSPLALMTELRKATCAANDVISERNDQEERRDRERMGTTVVMGLVQNHELYLTHLGDSRAYLITRLGCHQATLDDDVASREARLGYGTYRSALAHPGSGSLVQALGMGPSGSLHPTVQRLVLDDEGVLLLCSDGLSDNDLIESTWQSQILPILNRGNVDLAAIASKLVATANQHNGHDNVTVGLIHWVARHPSPFSLDASLAVPPTLTSSIPALSNRTTQIQSPQPTTFQSNTPESEAIPTKLVKPAADSQEYEPPASAPQPEHRILPLLFGIVFLLGLGGVLAYVLIPSVGDRINAWLGMNQPSYTDVPSLPDSGNDSLSEGTTDAMQPSAPLQVGTFLQTSRSDLDSSVDETTHQTLLLLYPEPAFTDDLNQPSAVEPFPSSSTNPTDSTEQETASEAPEVTQGVNITTPRLIPAGTVLRMISQQEIEGQGRWVRLRVCSTPLNDADALPSEATDDSTPSSTTATPSATEGSTRESTTDDPGASSELPPLLTVGDVGWVAEEQIVAASVVNPDLEETDLPGCQNSPHSPTPKDQID